MKIGVIDSGIGGLSVLKTLIKKCPNHEYIYFGDTINMPYGEKSKDEIINFGNNIIKFLENKHVDLIVIACGTLSSNVNFLNSSVPLIDVISPLKGKLDNYKNLAIMATPLSVKTNAFKKYIKTNYTLIPCPLLATSIENGNREEIEEIVSNYVKMGEDSDALVLGCTHYPIVKDLIEKFYKKPVITLDEFIVDIIKYKQESKYSLTLYFSKLDDKLRNNVKKILENSNLDIKKVRL